ncbi:MAG: hypothetical protein ACOZNI_05100 [Myxococcota bacterium]
MILLFAACALDCESKTGTLHVCASALETDLPEDARIHFAMLDAGEETEAVPGDDGCIEVEVPAGDYRVWGTGFGGCESEEPEVVTVTKCREASADVIVDERCIGR